MFEIRVVLFLHVLGRCLKSDAHRQHVDEHHLHRFSTDLIDLLIPETLPDLIQSCVLVSTATCERSRSSSDAAAVFTSLMNLFLDPRRPLVLCQNQNRCGNETLHTFTVL